MTFTHESGAPSYKVPGYFAADGNAGESSAESGTKWRAHLSPDKAGTWKYSVSFTRGKHAALDGGGAAVKPFDGVSGNFEIAKTDKQGRDFRAQGRLQYVGKHHLQFAGKLDRPQLGWPRGYGSQPLYRVQVTLLAGDRPQQTLQRTLGFRRITMPELLHFVVNGVPVFLRGGDWVTPNLMSRVWDQARTERHFALAENANFNAFRIWVRALRAFHPTQRVAVLQPRA